MMTHTRRLQLTAVFMLLGLAGVVSAAPGIALTESSFSFGKITQHAVLTKRFWIKSVGDKAAQVIEIKPDCGCTELFLYDSLIAPNDSVPIDVILHTRSFLGFIEKRPLIRIAESNDTTRIKLYAEILVKPEHAKPLLLAVEKVDVSQYSAKPRRKAKFEIINNGTLDYEITVVDSSAKVFEVVMPKKIKAGAKAEGQVIVRKEAIPLSFETSFTFEINDDARTRYSVPIWRQYQVKDAEKSKGK